MSSPPDDLYQVCKDQVCVELKKKPGPYWAALVLIIIVGIVILFILWHRLEFKKRTGEFQELSGPSFYQKGEGDGKTQSLGLIIFILVAIAIIALIIFFFARGNYQASIFISIIFLILVLIFGRC